MSDSANVRSIDAIKRFQAAVLVFQEDARQCVASLEMQLLRMIGWLERDRPTYWKREIESCYREMGEARVRLHQCRMRRVGDFRPTCFEEQKDLERWKKSLEFAQKQIPVVKYWSVCAHHEANEYHGRASQLTRMIEREIPQLLGLLHQAIDRLEAYNNIQVPGFGAPAIESGLPENSQDEPPQTMSEKEPNVQIDETDQERIE